MCFDNKPPLSVIGVGPGDPELLTLKAFRLIKSADVIFAPCSARKKDSLALEIVRGAFGPGEKPGETDTEIINQVYPMSRDRDVLKGFWDRAAEEVKEKLAGGKRGVFITLGDPSLYSTWSYLRPRLEERNLSYEIVCGIPSFFLGAALTGRELAIGEERLAVIPMPENQAELVTLMEQFDTLVLMKIGRAIDSLREMLNQTGYADRAWIVSRCGLSEEQVLPLNELKGEEESIGYLSHVIIYKEKHSREDIL